MRDVTLAQAQTWQAPRYKSLGRDEADQRVRDLLNRLALNSGLIQQRDELFSFSHYTFQEYLAARALDGLDEHDAERDPVQFLLARCADARWRETLLLAAGHWSNDPYTTKHIELIQALLAVQTTPALLLAGDVLVEIGASERLLTLRHQTLDPLQRLAFSTPPVDPDPRVRNHAATLLNRLDVDEDNRPVFTIDIRSELDLRNSRYWAEPISPGPFTMGDDNGDNDEKPAFVYHIRQCYALARFPVTNHQYWLFLEDLRARGMQKDPPRDWPGRRYRVGEANHPVVTVSWQDATEFARWANDQILTDAQRAVGEQIRLPTEGEWERAAAYPVNVPAHDPGAGRRAYPWGAWRDNEPHGIRANVALSKINKTSVVGVFPHGAADCGAQDLAGNVCEWCSTPYIHYETMRTRGVEPETVYTRAKNRPFVLRGGSWFNVHLIARCADRDLILPYLITYDNYGFRLARLFSLRSS